MVKIALLLCALGAAAADRTTQLYLDAESDLHQAWGLLEPSPTALKLSATLKPPDCDYKNGATVFAAFTAGNSTWEVYVAVGRPGEPVQDAAAPPCQGLAGGVSVIRFVTSDFINYSSPTIVLFLPSTKAGLVGMPLDQGIWTIKSMDRNSTDYLLTAFKGDSMFSFVATRTRISTANTFRMTTSEGCFKDHDDTNIVYSRSTAQWVDMQIFGAPWLDEQGKQTTCPHNLSDNVRCSWRKRRVAVVVASAFFFPSLSDYIRLRPRLGFRFEEAGRGGGSQRLLFPLFVC